MLEESEDELKEDKLEENKPEDHKQRLVRLTRDPQGKKVVKIEICVDKKGRCEIFDYFPDKIINWKEAAPHCLILKSLAAYKKEKLTDGAGDSKKKSVDTLAKLIKNLCHATAPLYSLINHSYLDDPFHPARERWEAFRKKNPHFNEIRLKIAFLQQELTTYQNAVNHFLQSALRSTDARNDGLTEGADSIKDFLKSHQEETAKFIAQLNRLLNESVLDEDQLRKLFSNQDEANVLNISSLGGFLRSQAHELAGDALHALDDITQARFEQLFSFSAHPWRKKLIEAHKIIDDLESTHMVRFLNTRSPIPNGQLAVLQHDDLPSEKSWMNIMPYVNGKMFMFGEGIGGSEGLDDVDQILSVYANGPRPVKKLYARFYDMLTGKKGVLGILAIIFLGLPALVVAAVGLVAGACLAMAVDLMVFLLQAIVILALFLLIALAMVADFFLQIPSFFTERWEIKFSFLAKMKEWSIPSKELTDWLRTVSVVRIFKQFLLDKHEYYVSEESAKSPFIIEIDGKKEQPLSKAQVLDIIKKDQAEGLFNAVASKFFSFATIAGFLHEKLKQFFYAARELRKVVGMMAEIARHFFSGEVGRIQKKQRDEAIENLKRTIEEKNKKITDDFLKALKETFNKPEKSVSKSAVESEPEKGIAICKSTWPSVAPWTSRQLTNPMDFASEIGLSVVGTVDSAFLEDPGIATPIFVLVMVCFGATLFPALAGTIPPQIVNGLQWFPKYVAKAFMGKVLETGLSGVATNIITIFLQWQLATYSMKAVLEVCHGNFDWVKKLFENPEEITLGSVTFTSMGYLVGLIPNLPLGNITSSDPFFSALGGYPNTIYNGFAGGFNAVIAESKEVVKHGALGPNTLELAIIGIKSCLLIHSLLSGTHETKFTPLNLDVKQLREDYKNALETGRFDIIVTLLREHGIKDPNSTLAKKIKAEFDALAKANSLSDDDISELSADEFDVLAKANSLSDDDISELSADDDKETFIEVHEFLTDDKDTFIKAREKVKELLTLVHDMEVLGIPIGLDLDKDGQTSYQSKRGAELVYDQLVYAIQDYNQSARRIGLFHEQIDGSHFLHNFYNKHCYAGSSGWHKVVFGILLFPLTWAWRGFKYLIGTPSMRHQVKKSFCKDFAMVFQLIPDVIAPVLRSFLKAVLYSVRMFLGFLVLAPLVIAGAAMLLVFSLAFIGIIPMSVYALVQGAQAGGATTFADVMKKYFSGVKAFTDGIWHDFLCASWVNDYLKWISLLGSTSGTGSPHRLNLLKTIGAASLYEYLTSVADTSFENLQMNVYELSTKLEKDSKVLVEERNKNESICCALNGLAKYSEKAESRLKPVSNERPAQLAFLSDSLLKQARGMSSPQLDGSAYRICTALTSDESGELAETLRIHKISRFFEPPTPSGQWEGVGEIPSKIRCPTSHLEV